MQLCCKKLSVLLSVNPAEKSQKGWSMTLHRSARMAKKLGSPAHLKVLFAAKDYV